jgi:VWFA-related protein
MRTTARRPLRVRNRHRLLVIAMLAFGAPVLAQDARGDAPAPEPSAAEQPTFRASANLVTVDAVVTDKDGRHITDLTVEDFEVTHGGTRQRLQHSVYVPLVSAAAPVAADAASARASTGAKAPLSVVLAQPSARIARTIAVVVDDLGLSFESTANVRRALRRFVDTQVQPGDLVAIIRTSGGIGALQQFTTDRRLLHQAVDRIRWSIVSRSGVGAFAPVEPGEKYSDPTRMISSDGQPRGQRNVGQSYGEDLDLEAIRHRVLAAGSLGALEFVVRGVQNLPGRKALVFVSEGFELFSRLGEVKVWNAFTRLMDQANRAGVVVYTIDGRGLESGHLTAEDDPRLRPGAPGGIPEEDRRVRELIIGAHATRQTIMKNSEEALHYLAWQTGGFAILNNNDLSGGLGRVLDDLRGYYLLGYDAPAGSPRNWDPDRIRVRVRRAGAQVRSRRGYFGPADSDSAPQAAADPLTMAAMSPFGGGAINLRLTSLFGHDKEAGPYIRSLLFIDPSALTFTRAEDERHEAIMDVLQVAVGDNGEVLGSWRRTITLRLTDEQLAGAQSQGVVYSTRMAVKTPGAYQVRAAVQDAATSAVGSASQFLEVPEVGKGRLALSGVLLQAKASSATAAETAASELEFSEAGDAETDILGKPTLRIFKPGSDVVYAYEVYDGLDEKRSEALEMRTTLLRNGRVVYEGPSEPVKAKKKTSRIRIIPIAGLLSLGDDVPAGTYTLQVSVAADKKRRASGWVDLEVRK